MSEQNLLRNTSALAAPNGHRNPKGRPRKQQTITFSSQPKSIVSQLIQNMMSQNSVILPIERNSDKNTYPLAPIQEFDQTQSDPRPKPKKKQPKLHSCEFSNCNYSTKLSSNLLKHRRRHTGEKPYLCDRCSFRTNFSNSLKVHRRLHTTERPYQCTNCDYSCNSISNLKKHSHTRHETNVIQTDKG